MLEEAVPLRPTELLINVQQGSTFQLVFGLKDAAGDFDLTGYSAVLTMRKRLSDVEPAAVWSSVTGEITVNVLDSSLELYVDSDATAALNVNAACTEYVFDLVISTGSNPPFKQTLAVGLVKVWRSATRD